MTQSGSDEAVTAAAAGHFAHQDTDLLAKLMTPLTWEDTSAKICWQAIYEPHGTRRGRSTGAESPRRRTPDRPLHHRSSATTAPDGPLALPTNTFEIPQAAAAVCRPRRAPTPSQRIPRTRAAATRNPDQNRGVEPPIPRLNTRMGAARHDRWVAKSENTRPAQRQRTHEGWVQPASARIPPVKR